MKTVIITGTSTGIGFELAKIFSKKNYNVISLSRSSNVVNIGSKNIDHIPFDITGDDDHQKLISNLSVIPDIVLCAVGFMGDQKDSENKQISRSEVIRTNFEGPVHLMSEFANLFEKYIT